MIRHHLACNRQHAGIGRHGPGHYFDEGGFAGAIFSHQRVHFTRTELERDALQRLHPCVRFGNRGSFEKQRQGINITRLAVCGKTAPSRSRLSNTLILQSRDRKGAVLFDMHH